MYLSLALCSIVLLFALSHVLFLQSAQGELSSLLDDVKLAVPAFHIYGHCGRCQVCILCSSGGRCQVCIMCYSGHVGFLPSHHGCTVFVMHVLYFNGYNKEWEFWTEELHVGVKLCNALLA